MSAYDGEAELSEGSLIGRDKARFPTTAASAYGGARRERTPRHQWKPAYLGKWE